MTIKLIKTINCETSKILFSHDSKFLICGPSGDFDDSKNIKLFSVPNGRLTKELKRLNNVYSSNGYPLAVSPCNTLIASGWNDGEGGNNSPDSTDISWII